MTNRKISNKGFTLIELAVALTIIALVIGGLAVPMSKRIAEQQYIDTQATIDKAIEALVGYAIQNRRLPCPDVDTTVGAVDDRDGFENIAGAVGSATGCSTGVAVAADLPYYQSDTNGVSWGDLPWQTLGLAPPNNADAWNNRLRYAVFTPLTTQSLPATPAYCNNKGTNAGIGLANLDCLTNPTAIGPAPAITAGVLNAQIDVRCTDPVSKSVVSPVAPAIAPLGCTPMPAGSVAPPTYAVSQNIVFIVYSMGAGGQGATPINSTTSRPFVTTARNVDQSLNATELKSSPGSPTNAATLRRQFVVRARTDANSNSGEFDDVMGYMSAPTLAAKLAAAGVWP